MIIVTVKDMKLTFITPIIYIKILRTVIITELIIKMGILPFKRSIEYAKDIVIPISKESAIIGIAVIKIGKVLNDTKFTKWHTINIIGRQAQ